MKRACLFIAFFCSSAIIIAQQRVTAYVFDEETKKPIDLVAVVSSVDYTITNSEGGFAIKVTKDDKIKLTHLSYQAKNVDFVQLSDSIFLSPRVYSLDEVIVLPKDVIYRRITAVWEKYDKLFARKRERDFPQQTFYFRQLTQENEMYTEYFECFFTAPVNVSVQTMTLQESRYALINQDSTATIINYFILSQLPAFSRFRAISDYTVNGFLVKNFKKYYDIRLDRVMSEGTEDEVEVYKFTPYEVMISENAMMLSGFLYIRSKDLAIVRMEIITKNILLRDIPDIVDETYNFTVTYRDGIESYPVVETVKCDTEVSFMRSGKEHRLKMYSVLFATDFKLESGGKKMRKGDYLLLKVTNAEYNQEFWDNNPIIKRTKIEQQVVDDFNRHGYFGTMDLNKAEN